MSDIQLNETALHHLLDAEDGPTGRDLQLRALNVETAQKRALSQPGTGRVYRRGGRIHQASAPGQPPAVDLGLLRATVGHHIHRDPLDGLVADIGSGANPAIPGTKVALWLDQGTRHIAPRPWLRGSIGAAR